MAIEVGKAEENLGSSHCCWYGPIYDCLDFWVIHPDAIIVDEHDKTLDFGSVKWAFFGMGKEIIIPELLEYFLHLGLMLLQRSLGEDHYIIDIDDNYIFHVHK